MRCLVLLLFLATTAAQCTVDQYTADDGSTCTFCPGLTTGADSGAGVGSCNVATNTWTVPSMYFTGGQPMGMDFIGDSTRILAVDALHNIVVEYDLAQYTMAPTIIAGENGTLGVCLEDGCESDPYLDNAPGLDVRFTVPTHVRVAPGGRYAFVSDTRAAAIRRIDLGGSDRYTDTVASNNLLNTPYDIAFTSDAKYMFVADAGSHVVYRLPTVDNDADRGLSGTTPWENLPGKQMFGQKDEAGNMDGDALSAAKFNQPIGLAVLPATPFDAADDYVTMMPDYTVFVADWGNGLIRRIRSTDNGANWIVDTLAGSRTGGIGVPVDGAGLNGAVLAGPTNMRLVYHEPKAPHVSLYFTDRNPDITGTEVGVLRVLQLYSDYGVRTVAGRLTERGNVDGQAAQSKLAAIWGIAVNSVLAVISEADSGMLKTISLNNLMKNFPCSAGKYQSGGSCVTCSDNGKPSDALFVTNGGQYDLDACEWECPDGNTNEFQPECFYPKDLGEPFSGPGTLFTTDGQAARSFCDPGFTTNGADVANGNNACLPAGKGFYAPGGVADAIACPAFSTTSNDTAFRVESCVCELGRFMNAEYTECVLCSQDECEPGFTRSLCTPLQDATCSVPCSNPAGSPNGTFTFTSGGSWDGVNHRGFDDCAYDCNGSPDGRGHWKNHAAGGYCSPCSAQECGTGEQVIACTSLSDSYCAACTNYPITNGTLGVLGTTFEWVSAASDPYGDPAVGSDCQFRCSVAEDGNSGYYLQTGTNTSGTCEQCSEQTCHVGFFRGQCQQGGVHSLDAQCYACVENELNNSHPVTHGEGSRTDTCDFECDAGFYLADELCKTRNMGMMLIPRPDYDQYDHQWIDGVERYSNSWDPGVGQWPPAVFTLYVGDVLLLRLMGGPNGERITTNIKDIDTGNPVPEGLIVNRNPASTDGTFVDVVFTAPDQEEYQRIYQINITGAVNQPKLILVRKCTTLNELPYDACNTCTDDPSICAIGLYLSKAACNHNSDSICRVCSDLPMHAFFNSSGVVDAPESCDFACAHMYFRNQSDQCQLCNVDVCPEGSYRTDCAAGSSADSDCIPCSSAPDNARLTFTPAASYNRDTCDFICLPGFFRSEGGCVACDVSVCPTGSYREQCLVEGRLEDAACLPCSNKHADSSYLQHSEDTKFNFTCPWECNQGFYFLSGTGTLGAVGFERGGCAACVDPACGIGQQERQCQHDQPPLCLPCTNKPGNSVYVAKASGIETNDCTFECELHFFLSAGSNTDGTCSACDRTACGVDGQYRDTCLQGSTADALCIPCAPIIGATLGLPADIYTDSCAITCETGFFRNPLARLCCDINAETDGGACVCLPGFSQLNEAVCLL